MLHQKMLYALNNQIKEELYSAYLYLSMSNWFDTIGLKGFATWMRVQFEEELQHAMKIFDYINYQGESVELQEIPKPPNKWDSPLHAFEETLKHEQHITKCINELVDLAEELKDRATFNFLQWFVDEQVEEEANDNEILDKLKLIGDSKNALFILDKELGNRKQETEN